MLIKRLSKIGLTLLLAVSFLLPVSFDARADFTSTDSTNLRNAAEDIANIYSRLGTSNTHLNNINTKLTNIYNDVGSIKTAVANTITTTLNQINTKLGNIYSAVDNLEGYLDTVETKLGNVSDWLDTINGNIVTMGNYVQAINNNESANGTVLTNTYNLLNTYTNNYISSIDKQAAVLVDQFTVQRYGDTQQTVSLTTPAGNTTSYKTAAFAITNFKIAYDSNNIPYVTYDLLSRYGNYRGQFNQVFSQIGRAMMFGYNTMIKYLHIMEMDLAYIGTELHLTYQLIDAFKSANHTDITNFAAANHTDLVAVKTSIDNFKAAFDSWVTNWTSWAKHIYILVDNICVRRISDTADTVTLNTFGGGTITYTLRLYPIYNTYFDSTDKKVKRESINTYSNFNGALYRYWIYGQNALFAYIQYVQDSSPANTIANSVSSLDQNLTNLNNAETAASSDAISRINSFVPNISDISSLVALSWCSTFLQNLYLALGTFNIPILCGLVLAVCMQFIGYFRYKT